MPDFDDPREVLKKLQAHEAMEIGVKLCVDCPMHERYVPIKGNCIDLELTPDGTRKSIDHVLFLSDHRYRP